MITITSVGLETVKAIRAGHNTNQKLSKVLDGTPEKMGSRVSRLRKQGLVRAYRVSGKQGKGSIMNDPLIYTVLDVHYQICNKPMVGRIPKGKRPKLYAEMGEPTFDNLNAFIYPKKLQEQLEE